MVHRSKDGRDSILDRIHEVLEGIRPRLRLDEADLVVIGLSDDGVLRLQLTGRHAACPVALATLQAGIDAPLRERVPQLRRIVVVG